jgi:hypothetical protein
VTTPPPPLEQLAKASAKAEAQAVACGRREGRAGKQPRWETWGQPRQARRPLSRSQPNARPLTTALATAVETACAEPPLEAQAPEEAAVAGGRQRSVCKGGQQRGMRKRQQHARQAL